MNSIQKAGDGILLPEQKGKSPVWDYIAIVCYEAYQKNQNYLQ